MNAFKLLLTMAIFYSANANFYYCTVNDQNEISDSGKIKFPNWNKHKIGEKFIVNKENAQTSGAFTSKYDEVTLLDKGSKKQNFKAIYITRGSYIHLSTLIIQEYNTNKNKPFIYTEGVGFYSGTCENM